MTRTDPPGDPTWISDIDQAHVQVRDLVARLDQAGDRQELLSVLEPLVALLPAHFAEEEAPGAFFAQARDLVPERSNDIDDLQRQHREILADAQALLDALRAEDDGFVANHRPHAAAIARALEGHERREAELLTALRYEETGAGD